jgi:endonuclease YncB( thermonuclease family)
MWQVRGGNLRPWDRRGTVVCESTETDTYGRHIASREHNSENVSAWLVREGCALAFRKYSSRLVSLEEEARAEDQTTAAAAGR